MSRVASPCIDHCCLDDERGWCLGCYRTIEEITGWSEASDEERRAVLQRIEVRRTQSIRHVSPDNPRS